MSTMQQIAESGATPIARVDANQAGAQNAPGYEAQGWALAQSVITENMHQLQARGVWNRYVARLYDFGEEARTFFLRALNADTKQRREHVKAQEGRPEHDLYRKANASAQVNISNLTTITRALNAGMVLEVKEEDGRISRDGQGNVILIQPFTTIIAQARVFLNAKAASGKPGRPALTFEQQLANFLAKTAKVNTDTDKEVFSKTIAILTEANILPKGEDKE